MVRLAFIYTALFFLPFVLYGVYLVLRRENPFTGRAWRRRDVILLGAAGFILSFVIFGTLARHSGELISGRKAETIGK